MLFRVGAMAPASPFVGDVLDGDVALVTGGGSGIGFEIALQLGLHGARLLLLGRRLPVLEAAKKSLSARGIQVEYAHGDVRSPDDAAKAVNLAVERFGKLSILVNSAAGNFLAPAELLTSKGFRTVLEIDTLGTFNMCHAAFPALKRSSSEKSVIINISATLHYGATWYQSHAAAAKAAIDSLTRSLSLEWGPIRVNGIAPGPIADTAGWEKLSVGVDSAASVRSREEIVEKTPAGRVGTTWDVAMAAVFLASSAGSWITGETIVVDGGNWLYYPPALPADAVAGASRAVEASSRRVGVPERSKL
ncbi:peroxisomal 2,4-dienoyl-CoA reductase [Selaginella moellendorffii]|nr:peroxisomal 2,4-dienoyl-CoA reductase [Selaginella moellendorffii]|eukprot:XP_002980582.2 peroxisomal 2,4-dienoyl-CoA reductase [Selaginella moellendorffii]